MRVAVVDPLPMFREGVAAVLSAGGHTVDTPTDPTAWASSRESRMMLLTLAADSDWELLRRIRDEESGCIVIALVLDGSVAVGIRAVWAGARSVIDREVDSKMLRRTIEATVEGQAVLPAPVATALASGQLVPEGSDPLLSAEQVAWLRHLAAGLTVAQVARLSGYSQRAMFRQLQALYRQLGAGSKIEAILVAQDQGWLSRGIQVRRS